MANLRKNKKNQKSSGSKGNFLQKKNSALDRLADSFIAKKRYKSLQTPRYFHRKSTKLQNRSQQTVNCSICGKKMNSLVEAMEHGKDAAPAHFTCVVRDLAGIYLSDGRNCRVVYKGKGSFSVVEQTEASQLEEQRSIYCFHSSIPYEKAEKRSAWRENLVNLQLKQVLEI